MKPTEKYSCFLLNYLHFHYCRNSITCSTIHTSVNAGFGVYISKCIYRLVQAFYSYSWAGLFIFWCFLTDFLQNFNNYSLFVLVHYYAQIYARLQPRSTFPLYILYILPTVLSTSVPYSQTPHKSPEYQSKLILLLSLHCLSTAVSIGEQTHEQEHQLHVRN